ncbi:MAG: tRNA-uridine aminocarboxypropyltransferase [Myxococcota bacterium]
MARHVSFDPRCSRCQLKVPLCMCAELVPVKTRTQVVILMHAQEAAKPTNTGRIAAACLSSSQLRLYANREGPVPERPWAPGTRPALLFPAPGARSLESLRGGQPVTLLVPDGTWRQAMRLRRRLVSTGEVPFVALPEGPASSYRLRSGTRTDSLSTGEAIARALGVLEGEVVQRHLERALAVFTERTLWMRGAIETEHVTGGIPSGVSRHGPLGATPSAEVLTSSESAEPFA